MVKCPLSWTSDHYFSSISLLFRFNSPLIKHAFSLRHFFFRKGAEQHVDVVIRTIVAKFFVGSVALLSGFFHGIRQVSAKNPGTYQRESNIMKMIILQNDERIIIRFKKFFKSLWRYVKIRADRVDNIFCIGDSERRRYNGFSVFQRSCIFRTSICQCCKSCLFENSATNSATC